MKKSVLGERIRGNERFQQAERKWERERRREDRNDRAVKDRELNGVRTQLLQQAGTFATKELVDSKITALDTKVDVLERTLITQIEQQGKTLSQQLEAAIKNLNTEGSAPFRERRAMEIGKDEATKEILNNTATNRRWLIGVIITLVFGILANLITLTSLVLHILKVF